MTIIDRLRNSFGERRRYSQTLRELRSLSTRDLEDIGISPADLHRIARDAARTRA
ncbi:DUF1127 domain-containing protein [Marinivivus vitaminiproducens]|uniref:DUF1127 domain-containing protein n=1 Tax=Marinivivus vitaminiproducens TaxID=3035935 RepID=UPI0027AB76BA|nr:DUF1127 domain-containing protein [Geminicoccaceae bacterium SCSIO 64248]